MSKGICELRWYTLKPDCMGKYAALTKEHFGLRTKHSPLMGFWTTEAGTLNQVFHVWNYESLAQRKQVRDALAKDAEWNTLYVANLLPLLQTQVNAMCLGAVDPIPDTPFFALDQLSADNQKPDGLWTRETLLAPPTHMGRWNLRSNASLDALMRPTTSKSSSLLYPAPFAKPFVTGWK